jgi:hypothetical protein
VIDDRYETGDADYDAGYEAGLAAGYEAGGPSARVLG